MPSGRTTLPYCTTIVWHLDYSFCGYTHLNLQTLMSSTGMVKNRWAQEKQAYKRLKDVVDRALTSSSYSEVNLAKLFQAFATFK